MGHGVVSWRNMLISANMSLCFSGPLGDHGGPEWTQNYLILCILKPCRSDLVLGNIKIFSHFLLLRNTEMAKVAEILPLESQWYIYSASSIPWLLTITNNTWKKVQLHLRIWLKRVPKGLIDNKSSLIQVMAWRRTGGKPLPETMPIQFIGA